jgi:hypothetical protein
MAIVLAPLEALSPSRARRRALILSPFATHPADAGQRRRVFQLTHLMRSWGYDVSFLLFAFELPWYWRFDEKHYQEMVEEWGDVQLFLPHHKVGLPPKAGQTHELDEWWDPQLETYLDRLFRLRYFDAFVVHNVWLSKAFDYAPKSTIRILDTHDIFWRRAELFASLGQPLDFFTPTRNSEIFGLQRADVVVTVTEEERQLIKPHLRNLSLTIPIYAPQGRQPERATVEYLHPKKVTFGVMGSAHIFNVTGLQQTLDALYPKIGRTYAPVDVVVAGELSAHVKTRLPIQRLGYVNNEEDFYKQVDFVIAPLFKGTGFKVKVADAAIFRKPILSATHAAIGTDLSPACCFDTADQLAQRMVSISLERPPLEDFVIYADEAARSMARRTEQGAATLQSLVEWRQLNLCLDLSELDPDEDLAPILAYASYLRPMAKLGRVLVAPPPRMAKVFEKNVLSGAQVVTPEALYAEVKTLRRKVILRPVAGQTPADLPDVIPDDAWRRADNTSRRLRDVLPIPMIHPDVCWVPIADAIRRWYLAQGAPLPTAKQLLFVDGPELKSALRENSRVVDLSSVPAFNDAVRDILLSKPDQMEIVWGGAAEDPRCQFVFELASLRGNVYFGPNVDGQTVQGRPVEEIHQVLGYVFDLTMRSVAAAV